MNDGWSVHHSSFLIHHFLILPLLLGAAVQARADDGSPQVWLVSTRGAPHCGDLNATPQELGHWRLDEDCQWSAADTAVFQATDDAGVPTVVFIHGNQTNAQEAVTKAWYAYELIQQQAGGRPFRYVIWSWPADRVYRRNNEDVCLKAAYSDVESYYLARWLDRLRPGVKVSLIGHSFGPRIITGALHLLAGGEVAGRSLPDGAVAAWKEGKRNPVRAVLLGAAIDADWLAPDGCHGLALSLIDQMLVTCNGCDRVLRWYPRMCGCGRAQALGFVGPCGVDEAKKVEVADVSSTVGRIHDWRRYCSAPKVCSRWAHYTFLEAPPAQP